MKNNELVALSDTYYYVTNENFRVGLEGSETADTQLGIVFKIIDREDIGLEYSLEYEVSVVASLVIHQEDTGKIFDIMGYTGGPSCDDLLCSHEVRLACEKMPLRESFEDESVKIAPVIFENIKIFRGDYTIPSMYGDNDTIEMYLNKVIELELPKLMMLVGFRLDNAVNLIGNTGWDLLEMQRNPDNDLITKRIRELA